MLIISIAKLAATAFAIPVIATPFKLMCSNTCKAIRGRVASSATQSNYIKGVLGKLIDILTKKF